ncbi:hypothetical protein [Larsenimonas suaedae]|uniref:Uncharacterized protein n=1 Tax=Larsenimonas suaedae TaxID=1851019 RepID=A0ABU1GU20_9GAMM|nr:hypothetical protein [Larsenimonas suaedae]MCM2971793.1 hypothetical protein [Larsenimonas suaedae]MDR5895345.1 hypothetical protein [Larsenimonas suaedae]
MPRSLSESKIIRDLADDLRGHLVRKAIRALQVMPVNGLLSGDDSGLANVWDEICVQLQIEQSLYWSAYEQVIYAFVVAYVDELQLHELEAIWLITEQGEDWDCELEKEREPDPVLKDDVVEYVVGCVYQAALDWTNERIRRFLDLQYMD